jgi:four helix bundle protein
VSIEQERDTPHEKLFCPSYLTLKLTQMFDFEKLDVYLKARAYNINLHNYLSIVKLDKNTYDQLNRASFSIMLNIAEGSGRFTKPDKRNFYVIARGSCFECAAIFDFLKSCGSVDNEQYLDFYKQLEELSKMLFALIKGLS